MCLGETTRLISYIQLTCGGTVRHDAPYMLERVTIGDGWRVVIRALAQWQKVVRLEMCAAPNRRHRSQSWAWGCLWLGLQCPCLRACHVYRYLGSSAHAQGSLALAVVVLAVALVHWAQSGHGCWRSNVVSRSARACSLCAILLEGRSCGW